MLWGENEELCKNPSGTTEAEYVYPGVNEQLQDETSLLNYHKAINHLRNKYPEIMRGDITYYDHLFSSKQLAFEKEWNDNKVLIVINFEESETVSLDISLIGEYKKCEGIATSGEDITFENNTLNLPPYAIAILSN